MVEIHPILSASLLHGIGYPVTEVFLVAKYHRIVTDVFDCCFSMRFITTYQQRKWGQNFFKNSRIFEGLGTQMVIILKQQYSQVFFLSFLVILF